MEKRSWEGKTLSHLTEMIEYQMLGTGCLHQRTTLSLAYTFFPPAQGQGGVDPSVLKTHKGSCPDQQRVLGVGKLCISTPHFQAAGVHTAAETPVPYSTNTETQPPLPKPAPISPDFPPLVIYTKCNIFSLVLQFSIDLWSPGVFLFFKLSHYFWECDSRF